MNANQLLSRCRCKNFVGVFPLDRLPSILPANAKFIVNTHSSNLPGEHWIAVDITKRAAFDPLGIHYPHLLYTYLVKRGILYFNRFALQSPLSQACGAFCIYFLHHGLHNLYANDFKHNEHTVVNSVIQCF